MKFVIFQFFPGYDCGSVTLPKNRSRDVDSLFGIFGNEKKPHYFLSTRESECRWVYNEHLLSRKETTTTLTTITPWNARMFLRYIEFTRKRSLAIYWRLNFCCGRSEGKVINFVIDFEPHSDPILLYPSLLVSKKKKKYRNHILKWAFIIPLY